MAHTVGILTLGCKVNQYESEAIAEAFAAAGFSVCPADEVCDLYVVNTCTVTAESDRKARQVIRRALTRNPQAFLLVTGCLAQRAPDSVARIAGVDAVLGNTEKLAVVKRAKELFQKGRKPTEAAQQVGDVWTAPFEPMRITRFDRTRAYIKVQDGCENRCSYCAISAARGRVRSKNPDEAVAEIAALTANGCREIVLTGIEIACYGQDLCGVTLADLLARIDALPGDFRVRLGSLDPSLLKDPFVRELATLKKLAPHFHLSVQSGSSRVLAAMRRKYNADMVRRAIAALRTHLPGAELTADFIVGFPGETEADFDETVALAREAEFLQIHVFPYSKRAGTEAAAMPDQLPETVKKARCAALIAEGKLLRERRMAAALGLEKDVLFETYEQGYAVGHTPEFFEVAAPAPAPLHAAVRRVRLAGMAGDRLIAEIVREL